MGQLTSLLVPLIILVCVALILWYAAERFSPDPFITKLVQIVVFAIVLIFIILKLLPLLHLG